MEIKLGRVYAGEAGEHEGTFLNVKWADDAFRCRPTSAERSSSAPPTAINDGHLPPGPWARSGFLPVERQVFLAALAPSGRQARLEQT